MRALNRQVAAVVDLITQTGDALGQSRYANRRRAEVDAAFALTVAQRHTEDRDSLSGAGRFECGGAFNRSFHQFSAQVSTGSGSYRAKPLPIADLRFPIGDATAERDLTIGIWQ